jgi:5-oxoprolinase (ATP-hydrolysing)
MTARRYRLGFDIGGTFTDFALHDGKTGDLRIHKTLTTADDPSRGAIDGIMTLVEGAGLALADISEIVHGTTLVTNALIEAKGASTGLLTTRGFRDVLEIGYEQRYDVYDLFLKFPTPLVPRKLRLEIGERLSSDGDVLTPLDKDAVRREAEFLLEAGVKALAVSFLHSYRNPEHELAVGRLLAENFPELAVSLSCEVAPEVREYERVCTTVANAFVQPLMSRYLATLQERLAGNRFSGRLSLMLSSGGLATPDVARRFPIRCLESGPAGGALATTLIGKKLGRPDLISFDMGGTTAKAALVQDGKAAVAPAMEVARVHRFKKGSGFPVRSPVVEMIEIGAGGGSIAYVDEVGLIKVGPHSAGAEPGPACYGLGGTAPTVTDANLVLGYLDPGFFLGGRMKLDKGLADRALEKLGKSMSLDVAATAWGVHTIVSENMAAAARAHIVERGRDPRGFAMVAFGGAGPAHAAKVARIIGVREVLIPPASGAASAVGFLVAPASAETVRSAVMNLDTNTNVAALDAMLREVEAEARTLLAGTGVDRDAERIERRADMRLHGQMHEIAVPLPEGRLGREAVTEIRAAFIRTYEALYRNVPPDAAIEVLSWRVRITGPEPEVEMLPRQDSTVAGASKGKRQAFFGEGFVATEIYDRYALRPGDSIVGPAIIEEREATTIIPPGDRVEIDQALNLKLTIGVSVAKAPVAGTRLSLEESVARIESDPIGLEIMWARLGNITDECWDAVCRTAFSLIISDAQDFSVALFDRDGKILAHSPRAQPVFNLCLPRAIEALLQRFPNDTLAPGDVLVTNDPWLTSGHLFDLAIVTPVFHGGKVIGHVGTVGHVTDIGGTKDPAIAQEIYDEGFQIPPMKLFVAGQRNEVLFELLMENVRDRQQVWGDIHALVGASALGAERLGEFLTEYGLDDLTALATIFQGRSETAMRNAIRAIPDGTYESEIEGQVGDFTVRLPVKVLVKDDGITIDFTGAPPEIGRGGVNCTLNYTSSHATYPFKCLLTPAVRSNSGCYRPFTVRAPEGSILNCRKPVSVSRRQLTGWFLGPNIFSALAQAIPGKVRAFSGLPFTVNTFGTDGHGKASSNHLFGGGGQGGSAASDGKSGLLYPIGSANISAELFEIRTDVLIAEKQLARDSGGSGRHRGGLGQSIRIEKRLEGTPTQLVATQYGRSVRVRAMLDGIPGAPVDVTAEPQGSDTPQDMSTSRLWTMKSRGSAIMAQVAGGHGYGDPLERAVELVQQDVENDYVSRERAEADYGCVFDAGGRIDHGLTKKKRALLRRSAQAIRTEGEVPAT